jgi:hypothetical protein
MDERNGMTDRPDRPELHLFNSFKVGERGWYYASQVDPFIEHLENTIREIEKVRDEWCEEYTKLRDSA